MERDAAKVSLIRIGVSQNCTHLDRSPQGVLFTDSGWFQTAAAVNQTTELLQLAQRTKQEVQKALRTNKIFFEHRRLC